MSLDFVSQPTGYRHSTAKNGPGRRFENANKLAFLSNAAADKKELVGFSFNCNLAQLLVEAVFWTKTNISDQRLKKFCERKVFRKMLAS